jgi:hypothetical protein
MNRALLARAELRMFLACSSTLPVLWLRRAGACSDSELAELAGTLDLAWGSTLADQLVDADDLRTPTTAAHAR